MTRLRINAPLLEKFLCGFIQDEVRKAGFSKVVLGLSGGIDSSLVAHLAAKALGEENVFAYIMPYKSSHPESRLHAELVTKVLGIPHQVIDITKMVDPYFELFPDADKIRRGNAMSRERMLILYDQSYARGALVIGTSNKTELLLGYGTLYGDMSSALNPIGDLYKEQVIQLAKAMGVPAEIIMKAPTADLWMGQTDEQELGFSYHEIDELLYYMIDLRYSKKELIQQGFKEEFISHIENKVRASHFKRRLPVIAKISNRTIDRDFRYARDWGR